MQQKLQTRAFERVAGMLHPGEQPLAAARAMVGGFSSGRFSAVLNNAMAMELGGALGASLLSTRKQFIVVTNYRLIFMPQTILGGPGKKILGEVPRAYAALAEVKMGYVSLVRIAFGGQGDGIALTFPRTDKKNAAALAAVLSGATTGADLVA